jgi:hypothetical protein
MVKGFFIKIPKNIRGASVVLKEEVFISAA